MVKYTANRTKLVLLPLAITAFFLAGTLTRAADSKMAAPDWQLTDVDGKPVKLSDFKGKVIILDFWATWCPPCRAEIPGFVAIQKKYADRSFTVIGVSLDEQGPSMVKPFMRQLGMNYPVVMGIKSAANEAADFGSLFRADMPVYRAPEKLKAQIQAMLRKESASPLKWVSHSRGPLA